LRGKFEGEEEGLKIWLGPHLGATKKFTGFFVRVRTFGKGREPTNPAGNQPPKLTGLQLGKKKG